MGLLPWRDRWKARILALISSGRRALDMPWATGGRRALDRTPKGVEDADMGWPGFWGSEMERSEGILLGMEASLAMSLGMNSSGVGVSGVSGGDCGVVGESAIVATGRPGTLCGAVVVMVMEDDGRMAAMCTE